MININKKKRKTTKTEENNITIKPAITVMACRKALEITVRWLYKVEDLGAVLDN